MGGAALGIWASFAITIQEPRISLQEDPVTLRKTIRICVVAAAVGGLLPQVFGGGWAGLVAVLLGSVLQLGAVVSFFGELVYLRRFAVRVPDLALAKSTRIVQWGGAITLSFWIILALLVGFLGGVTTTTITTTGGGGIVATGPTLNAGLEGMFAMSAMYACSLGIASIVFALMVCVAADSVPSDL